MLLRLPLHALTFLLFLLPLPHIPHLAAEQSSPSTASPPSSAHSSPIPSDYACVEQESVTQGQVQIGGTQVNYTAQAGTLVLRNAEGVQKASLFYVAYTKDLEHPIDSAKRPITFCTNGGPGSSSVWLHMGLLGPKRIALNDTKFTAPPYELLENTDSMLDQTDLVFIDPISTGFSRAANGEATTQFHGVREDVQWIAQFIRLYLTRHNRWISPKFFFGESYGTTRAAALLYHLHSQDYIDFNGACLLSMVLDFQTHRFDPSNDLPYLLILPSFTAAAWYHQKLPKDLQADLSKALQEAENFALNGYGQALLKGAQLAPAEEEALAQKLARLTGLSPLYIRESNFRIDLVHFAKQLLKDQKKVIGRFDSRVTGIDIEPTASTICYDTSWDVNFGAFTAGFNQYVRQTLKWNTDLRYNILANVRPWNFDDANNRYYSSSQDLRELMLRNPKMHVFVASGLYDLATPYFAGVFTLQQMLLPPDIRAHITMGYYDAGHLMYVHPPSLKKLRQDLAAFYKKALTEGEQ